MLIYQNVLSLSQQNNFYGPATRIAIGPRFRYGRHSMVSADEMGEADTSYRCPTVQKGTWDLSMLHTFLSFSIVQLFVDCTN